nr:GDP-mannose mannosyl hydrolase [Ferrimonas balearica]
MVFGESGQIQRVIVLSVDTFKMVVSSTPLISIDLIIKDSAGRVLLGKRSNRPAQGDWFVPGGRVLKDELLEAAYHRLLYNELGVSSAVKAKFIGVYQHFYSDNFSGSDFSTHYVVLAYQLSLDGECLNLPIEQHSEYRWFKKEELLNCEQVHCHTKWYFQSGKTADFNLV